MAVGGLDGGIFRKRHDAAHATRLRIQQTRATTSSLGTVDIATPLDSSQGRGSLARAATLQRAWVTNRRPSRAFYSQRGPLNLIESLDVTATMAATQDAQTSTITATHVANSTGTIAVTQTNQTSTITATHVANPTGTIAATQTAQTSTITATSGVAVTASLAVTQGAQVGAFTSTVGYENVTGTIAVVQGDQSCTIHAQRFGGVSQDRIEPGPVFPGRTRRRYFNASKNPVTGP